MKWVPIIPLIGGFPLGAEEAFGCPPAEILSYDGFYDNDQHYHNYKKTINYSIASNYTNDVDVVVGTPPCSGLSTMNAGTSPESKGAGCHKNDWMYKIFEEGARLNAKVIAIENAPALYTKSGKEVADKIYEICKSNGYSLTLYKTSTSLHGIPQVRDRTFAIAWNSEKAPIMNWHDRDKKTFKEYLSSISNDCLQQNNLTNSNLLNEPFLNYIKSTSNRDPRELLIESNCKTTFVYVCKTNQLEKALEWFKEQKNDLGIKQTEHAIKKISINKNVWDASTRVFDDVINGVIGKNIDSTIHPIEDRSLSVRECLSLMGFPDDFELINPIKNINHIAQNVPVPTARDMCLEIKKFLNGELEFSDTDFIKQNNHKKVIEYGKSEKG